MGSIRGKKEKRLYFKSGGIKAISFAKKFKCVCREKSVYV